MIYRHCIAPPRAFTQFSHDLIRHPRLSSDAVRLLTWQLSLPQGARESLSRTAERARIGATAFTRAKRQLKEEGFVHERRVQVPGGLWVTQQLVSNVPLNPGEAAKVLAQTPVAAAPVPAPAPTSANPVSPQVAPSRRNPAVGVPTPRSTDGHPRKDPGENTSHHPAAPEPEPEPRPEPDPVTDQARALVAALPHLSPDLRRIPRGMHDELTHLTARWLAAGHTPAAVRTHLLRGLPSDGTPVHRPGGLLRHLLREVPPPPDPPVPHRAPGTTAARSGPEPGQGRPAHLSARLATLRECEGDHVQATLFRPVGDETRCPRCRQAAHSGRTAVDAKAVDHGTAVPGCAARPGTCPQGRGSTRGRSLPRARAAGVRTSAAKKICHGESRHWLVTGLLFLS
ncbi:hypothetical protein ACFYNZ_10235 [Streptomyces kebangsaanensis]|uniref:Helix-turn-helix domain-containing protein n=1 Tax=Streptomyces kebangsaanensis TaxID=864058 RepID=A0ABW6KPR9_9ACTN